MTTGKGGRSATGAHGDVGLRSDGAHVQRHGEPRVPCNVAEASLGGAIAPDDPVLEVSFAAGDATAVRNEALPPDPVDASNRLATRAYSSVGRAADF